MASPRLPIKKTRKLAEAEEVGKLKARVQHRAKTLQNKKQLRVWLVERLERILDKVDPLKTVAVITLTFLIKSSIDWTNLIKTGSKGLSILYNILLARWTTAIAEGAKDIEPEDLQDEMLEWVISFIVAYMVIEYGGEMIRAGGDLLNVAKGLIGGFFAGG